MNEPALSWYVVGTDSVEEIDKEYYAGAYSPSNTEFTMTLQIWNNKWGTEDVADIDSPKLVIMFDTIEDATLLNYCKVRIDGGSYEPLTIQNTTQGYINLNRILSGASNLGNASASNNFATIAIKFGPITHGMTNGLKNMLLEIQYN